MYIYMYSFLVDGHTSDRMASTNLGRWGKLRLSEPNGTALNLALPEKIFAKTSLQKMETNLTKYDYIVWHALRSLSSKIGKTCPSHFS